LVTGWQRFIFFLALPDLLLFAGIHVFPALALCGQLITLVCVGCVENSAAIVGRHEIVVVWIGLLKVTTLNITFCVMLAAGGRVGADDDREQGNGKREKGGEAHVSSVSLRHFQRASRKNRDFHKTRHSRELSA